MGPIVPMGPTGPGPTWANGPNGSQDQTQIMEAFPGPSSQHDTLAALPALASTPAARPVGEGLLVWPPYGQFLPAVTEHSFLEAYKIFWLMSNHLEHLIPRIQWRIGPIG